MTRPRRHPYVLAPTLLPILALLAALLTAAPLRAEEPVPLTMKTSAGIIGLEVYPDRAPVTAANFLRLVDARFYEGIVFHRVVAGFVIQAGGFDSQLRSVGNQPPIVNESGNGLRNRKGTLAMARMTDPDSADTQFFINVSDNPHLDAARGRPGYAVFGRVTSGWDVVEHIELADTHVVNGMAAVPEDPVIIESIERVRPAD